MDPSTRTALIDQARVAGLFDTDFMPEEDLDTIEIVETAAGALLILTALEASLYADAQVKARTTAGGAPEGSALEAIFGERTMVALERLGRLRARALENLGADIDPARLRDRLLVELERALNDVESYPDGEPRTPAGRLVETLAAAWRDLGGKPEHPAPMMMLPAATAPPAGPGLNDLEARRLAGHVYQSVQSHPDAAAGQAEAAEIARAAVIEGLAELRTEAGA